MWADLWPASFFFETYPQPGKGPLALFRTGLIMGTDPWPVCMGSGSGSADYSQMEGVLSRRGLRNLIGLGSGSGSAG